MMDNHDFDKTDRIATSMESSDHQLDAAPI